MGAAVPVYSQCDWFVFVQGNVCVAKAATDCYVQLTRYSASLNMKSGNLISLTISMALLHAVII